jgi:hypothetical protein
MINSVQVELEPGSPARLPVSLRPLGGWYLTFPALAQSGRTRLAGAAGITRCEDTVVGAETRKMLPLGGTRGSRDHYSPSR